MLLRWYFRVAYFISWPVFAAGACLLALACAPLQLLPPTAARERRLRAVIRTLFRAWVWWLRVTGLIRFEWSGMEAEHLPRSAVYIANHPGLLDATFLLARLPDPICFVKPAIMHNPLLGAAARVAGYSTGEGGVDMIRDLAGRLAAGQSVLIFPEGTRTRRGHALNSFKPGFALIAIRAGVPVQPLFIAASRDLLPYGRPWWRPPDFPCECRISAEERMVADPAASVPEFVAAVERRYAAAFGVAAPA